MAKTNVNSEYIASAEVQGFYNMLANTPQDVRVTDPTERALHEAMIPEMFARAGALPHLERHYTPYHAGRFRSHIEGIFDFRREIGSFFPVGYGLRIVDFAIDVQMRQLYENYPNSHTDPRAFHDAFPYIDLEEIDEMASIKSLNSTIKDGYAIIETFAKAMERRSDKPLVVLDVGTGSGHGVLQWAKQDKYPFKGPNILQTPPDNHPITADMPPDTEYQAKVEALASRDLDIDCFVGIDLLPVLRTKADLEWSFSNTYPFQESEKDPDGVAEFKALTEETSEKVNLVGKNVDATDEESLTILDDILPGGKADIIIISAMLFQMSPENVHKVLLNLQTYANKDARYFIADFAKFDKNSPNNLKFTRGAWWHKLGQFALLDMDPHNLDTPPRELARHLTRRCKQTWLSPAGKKIINHALGDI